MPTVSMHAARTHLSQLLRQVASGEEIIITKRGKPVAKLVELTPADGPKRRLGGLAGKAVVPAEFDAPLPSSVIALFEGADVISDNIP